MTFSQAYRDTIQVQSVTGVDGAGKPSYGAARQVKCKIQEARGRILVDGILVDANHVIKCADATIEVTDRIMLPTGEVFVPAGIKRSTGLTGTLVTEVVL